MQSPRSTEDLTEARPASGTLALQLIDGFSRKAIGGARVCFGTRAAVAPGEPAFRHDGADYRTILSLRTDEQGWVMFKNAHRWRGEACAICVVAEGYRSAFGGDRDVLTSDVMPVEPDEDVVATALLAPEEPTLGEDVRAAVRAYLASLSSVRVQVLQGANFGNQSAAFALIQTLRLAGYKGEIRVLADAAPRIEEQRIQAELTFLVDRDEERSGRALLVALEERIGAAYAGRVRFHEAGDVAPPPLAFAEPVPLGRDGPPTLDELTRRLAAFKDGLLAQLRSERDRAASFEPSGRLRRACVLDLTDRPWPYPLPELAALIGELAPLGLTAYAIREGTEVLEAADLSTRAAAGSLVPVALAVELTVRTRGDVSVMDKLRLLRPDLATAEDLAGVTWIEATRFDEDASADPTVLGFLPAGEDYRDDPLEKLKREVLKTGCVIALEPFSWFPDQRSLCLPQGKPQPLCLPRSAAYQLTPAPLAGAGKLIAALCAAAGQAALIAPLTALLELAAAKKVDLMTVYGLHQAKRSPIDVVVNNLIASLAAVQARRGRPTVVLAIYAREDLASHLDEARAMPVTYTTAAEALPHLGEVEPGEVLLVHAPMLPLPVFQLFCQASTLPLVLEGANTTRLAQMLGSPYLSIASTDTDYVRLAGPDCPDYRWLKRYEDELNQAPSAGQGREAPRRAHLEEYLSDTLTHGREAMRGYFTRLQRHVQRPEQNQVLLALARLVIEMRAGQEAQRVAARPPILSVGELPDPPGRAGEGG